MTSCFVGLITSVVFILIQPLFGMTTLTSRHAAAYVNLGNHGEMTSLFLSWFVHISVSLFYALVSSVIFSFNHSMLVSVGQAMILGWFTTLIATPANEWVVKLVTTKQFPDLSSLAALNAQIGPKLWLHIMFFILVLSSLYLIKIKSASKKGGSDRPTGHIKE